MSALPNIVAADPKPSYEEVVAPLLAESARFTVERVRVAIREAAGRRFFAVDYAIKVPLGETRSRLLFDHRTAWLKNAGIDCDCAEVCDLTKETGHYLFTLEARGGKLPRRLNARFYFEWPAGDEPTAYPFVSFPEILPKPASARQLDGDYLCAPVYVEKGSLILDSVVGVQRGPGCWNPLDKPQVQVAFVDPSLVTFVSRDVLIARYRHAPTTDAHYVAIAEEVLAMSAFLTAELGVAPSARFAVLAEPHPRKAPVPPGVLVGGDLEYTGVDSGDLRVLSSHGLRKIASAWWGVGVRVPGHAGAAVTVGICHALMLLRLALQDRRPEFGYFFAQGTRQANSTPAPDDSVSEHGLQFAMALALRLLDAFRTGLAPQRKLRALTKELWGRKVSAELVVRRLGKIIGDESLALPDTLASR